MDITGDCTKACHPFRLSILSKNIAPHPSPDHLTKILKIPPEASRDIRWICDVILLVVTKVKLHSVRTKYQAFWFTFCLVISQYFPLGDEPINGQSL